MDTTGESLKAAADYVLNSEDNCESLVDGLLAIESGAPVDEEYDYIKGTLIGLINSSPGVLLDVSAAMKSLSLEEAVEISEVGLELSCVGIVLSRFVLEKVDVEGIVDEMYDSRGAGMIGVRNGKVVNPWVGEGSGEMEVEFLDVEEEEEEEVEEGTGVGGSNAAGAGARKGRRKLKKLPLVFWPRISKILLSPFTHSDHPIRHYISNNPKLSFLISLFLLSPPAVLLSVFLMPPLLITDEIVHKVYGSLVSAYPDTFDGVEITTRQVFELIKLYVLLGKLFFKMTYRILQRQVKRRGGVTGVAKIAAGKIGYGVMHPLETTENVWKFTKDMYSLVRDLAGTVYDDGRGGTKPGYGGKGVMEIRR